MIAPAKLPITINTKQPHVAVHSGSVLLDAVETRRPALAQVVQQYGKASLSIYAETFKENNVEPIQSREDFIEEVEGYAGRLLGASVAKRLSKGLHTEPVLLTANHHGPDFLSITVQGNLLFGMTKRASDVLPVLAFGDIPLNNITYPRGIVTSAGDKINIFPDRDKSTLVSVAKPYTAEMLTNARGKVNQLERKGNLTSSEAATFKELLNIYGNSRVLAQQSYSDQSVLINSTLWKQLFAPDIRKKTPDMAFLEMEKVVTNLLIKDLSQKTLMHEVLLNPTLRNAVMKHLDGIYGCWKIDALQNLTNASLLGDERRKEMQGSGTAFFWGVDPKGRRYPMHLDTTRKEAMLRGVDDSGNEYAITFSAVHIADGLKNQTLLPSLMTSFSIVAFARGFKCYGGFMQTDYLTEMKSGLIHALQENGYDQWTHKIHTVPTDNYSTGMNFIVVKNNDGKIQPAGTLAIMAKGGLTASDWQQIQHMTVKSANMLGLPAMYSIVYREQERDPNLLAITREAIYASLEQSLLEIQP